MAKKKKKDERNREDAESRASSSAVGEATGAGPPAKMKRGVRAADQDHAR